MLKILLKKQMAEIFRSYFYNPKTGKKRSALATLGCIVGFSLLIIVLLGGIFTVLAVALCLPLTEVGAGWLYFCLFGLLSVVLGVFGSVFNTYAGLYLGKDNDLLLSMPIPVSAVIVSRLLGVYLTGLIYSAVVILPAVIVWFVLVDFSVASLLGALALILFISVIVLLLSCLLGYAVARISQKLKSKSFITVVLSLAFIAVYYFFYFKAESLIQLLIANAALYSEQLRGSAYFLYLFGCIGLGHPAAIGLYAAVLALLSWLTWRLLSKSFLQIATSSTSHARKKQAAAWQQRSPFASLLSRELRRFASSANYMLNCGLGILFLTAAGVLLLIKGPAFLSLMEENLGFDRGTVSVLLCLGICVLSVMNSMAGPSVSLEGKYIWQLQMLPVDTRKILNAKLCCQLLLSGIPTLFCSLCAAIALKANGQTSLLLLLTSLLFTVFYAAFCLFTGLKMPVMTWSSEIVPIKQSLGMGAALFGGWAYGAIAIAAYFLFGRALSPALYLAAVSAVTLLLALLLLRWIHRRGCRIFAAL